jgi:hypothetical protein
VRLKNVEDAGDAESRREIASTVFSVAASIAWS